MEANMIITFFGHAKIYEREGISDKVEAEIKKHVLPKEKAIFYLGGYGDYDDVCLRAVTSLRKKGLTCEIVLVTPYLTLSDHIKEKLGLYDCSVYPPLEKVPLRFAISKRNEWMINESDLIIAYVKHTYGGAYTSIKYAERKGKTVINIAQ